MEALGKFCHPTEWPDVGDLVGELGSACRQIQYHATFGKEICYAKLSNNGCYVIYYGVG